MSPNSKGLDSKEIQQGFVSYKISLKKDRK